jgi:hypothetical protein
MLVFTTYVDHHQSIIRKTFIFEAIVYHIAVSACCNKIQIKQIARVSKFYTVWIILIRIKYFLTLILPTWTIGWAPNNASKWQLGFNSAFKGLRKYSLFTVHTIISIKVNTINEHYGNLCISSQPPYVVPPSCSARESLWTGPPCSHSAPSV